MQTLIDCMTITLILLQKIYMRIGKHNGVLNHNNENIIGRGNEGSTLRHSYFDQNMFQLLLSNNQDDNIVEGINETF